MFMVTIRSYEKQSESRYGKWNKMCQGVYECPYCLHVVRTEDICAFKFCCACGKNMMINPKGVTE